MENFFTHDTNFEPVYENIINDPLINNIYFETTKGEHKEIENYEKNTIEELLDTFEAESEKTISLKTDIMKKISHIFNNNKYKTFYTVNDYVNKYFYDLVLMDEKNLIKTFKKNIVENGESNFSY